jgi:hypothetical protein
MRSTYRGIAYLIALGVALQASFVAFGWFDVINDMGGGAVFSQDSEQRSAISCTASSA